MMKTLGRMVSKSLFETRITSASLNCDWCLRALLLTEINQTRILLNVQLQAFISHCNNGVSYLHASQSNTTLK